MCGLRISEPQGAAAWYWIKWETALGAWVTGQYLKLSASHKRGLGVKEDPYLENDDRLRMLKPQTIQQILEEGTSGEECQEGGSQLTPVIPESVSRQSDNEPIRDKDVDDELSTLTQTMATITETMTMAGIVGDNPMSPPPRVADEVQAIQQEGRFFGTSTMLKDVEYPRRRNYFPVDKGKGQEPDDSRDDEGGESDSSKGRRTHEQQALYGKLPKFDGDKTKSLQFEKEFGLCRLLNSEHAAMKVPMLRIALALSCMEGEKVDQWKGAYANKLADLCWLNGRMVVKMKKTDERLWNDFFIAF